MTITEIADLVTELAVLRFFPVEPAARLVIIRLIGEMTHNDDQIRWLIKRMTSGIYAEWPGIAELRACFCCRYKPKDGIEAHSTVYPEGLPPDPMAPPRSAIMAGNNKRLMPGEPVTADPEFEFEIRRAAEKRKMPTVHPAASRFGEMLRDLETPPDRRQGPERPVNLDFKPLTQADVDRAREEYRARKGSE